MLFRSHTRPRTGDSSKGKRTYCRISNGCRPHPYIREPTTEYSGEPYAPSMIRSGTSTDRGTGGTASARSHQRMKRRQRYRTKTCRTRHMTCLVYTSCFLILKVNTMPATHPVIKAASAILTGLKRRSNSVSTVNEMCIRDRCTPDVGTVDKYQTA